MYPSKSLLSMAENTVSVEWKKVPEEEKLSGFKGLLKGVCFPTACYIAVPAGVLSITIHVNLGSSISNRD